MKSSEEFPFARVGSLIVRVGLIVGTAMMSLGSIRAELVVVDLSGAIVGAPPANTTFQSIGLGNNGELRYDGSYGSWFRGGLTTWSSGKLGSSFFQSDSTPAFPATSTSSFAVFTEDTVYPFGSPSPANGSMFDAENWIAFENASGAGWLSFDLSENGIVTGFNHFVYEPTGGSAPTLQAAAAEVSSSPIPEPSSALAGILLAIGILHRRRH